MLPALFDKAEIDGFLVTQRGQGTAHGKRAAFGFKADARGNRRQWRRGGQLLIAHHAHDFFDQVFLDLQVKAVAGRQHGQRAWAFGHGQTKALERISALGLRQRHTDHFDGACYAQGDGHDGRQADLDVVNGAALGGRCTANIQDQLRDALNVLHSLARVHATLKAVAGIG